MSRKLFLAILVFACASTLFAQTESGKRDYLDKARIELQGTILQIEANDPRPLHQVMEGLTERFHWNLSYEDPRYDYPDDVIDNTPAELLDDNPGGKHFYIPAGGAFAITLKEFNEADPKNELRTLDEIVKAYNKSKNPGRFKVLALDGDAFTIVGTGAARGSQIPLLDTKISLNAGLVPGDDALNQLAEELSKKTGFTVSASGTGGEQPLRPLTVPVRADSVPARVALEEILKALGAGEGRAWDLSYDCRDKTYLLITHR
jgi:hypothetical protein